MVTSNNLFPEKDGKKMPIALACTRDAVMMPDSEIAW